MLTSPPMGSEPLEAFVEVRCLCGRVHTMSREKADEGSGLRRWRCGTCKRRFILSEAPDTGDLWPVFLDDVPSTGQTRQEGTTVDDAPPEPPDRLHFSCRCGCRLVARGRVPGGEVHCPRCKSRLKLRAGVRPEDGSSIALVEHLD
jgi:hypothetical protein